VIFSEDTVGGRERVSKDERGLKMRLSCLFS